MINFVINLSRNAKAHKQDFWVFVQNAEELLTDRQYRKHIDGVAKEDLLYGTAHDMRHNPKAMRKAHIRHLKLAQSEKLPVLVVEYLSDDAVKSKSAVREIRKLGFVPQIAERSLSSLPRVQD